MKTQGKKTNSNVQFNKKAIQRMARANDQSKAAGVCGLAFLTRLWACDRIKNPKSRQACYDRATRIYNDCMDRAGF